MGKSKRLKVGVLTSSRADYSIYYPLLKKMNVDPFFEMEVLAFGTHLMEKFGRTVENIYRDGFKIVEIPVTHYPRTAGKGTGAALNVIVKSFVDLFKLWRKLH